MMDTLFNVNSVNNYAISNGSGASFSIVKENSDNSTLDFGNLTISQIRALTDRLACEGKLTAGQQGLLICSGLQDLDAAHPDIHASDNDHGYNTSDTNTYNFSKMMNDAAAFAESSGYIQSATSYRGIATAVAEYESNFESAQRSESR